MFVIVVLLMAVGSRLGWLTSTGQPKVVVLCGFTGVSDVMQEALLPAFRERWPARGEIREKIWRQRVFPEVEG